jgi:DNA invertase Pin-like site-specific DNA recombinase
LALPGVVPSTHRHGLRETLPAVRPGEALPVTKADRFARPYTMLENIIEGMTRGSQEFRLPIGMIMRV